MKRRIVFLTILTALAANLAIGAETAEQPTKDPAKLYREPFGVVGFHNSMLADIDTMIEKMNAIGVQWSRIGFPYRNFNPERRKLFTPIYKDILAKYEKNGIQAMGQIAGNRIEADWEDPEEMARFREFVAYCVETFPQVKHWEIWNEPDGEHFFGQKPNPDYYMAIVKAAYETIKKLDPEAKVIVGGFTQNGLAGERNLKNGGFMMAEMLRECYKRGLKDYSDIISFHPYTNIKHPRHGKPMMHAKIGESIELMREYGDGDKPVWLSEVGIKLGTTPSGMKGETADVTLEEQAEWLKIYYDELLRYRNVEKIFWMVLRNWTSAKPNDTASIEYGLYLEDWSETPSAVAFREMTEKYADNPYWIENTEPFDLAPVRFYKK